MLKLIKWLLGLFFAFILLIIVAVILLPMVIDPNDYKEQITDLVKQKTGRELSIQQDLKLSVFPWLGVETGQVIFGNAAGFGDKPFAQIEQFGLKIKLLPLLKKQIEVDTLVLDGLQLNLMKNKAGITNWSDLQKIQAQQQASSDTKDESGAEPNPNADTASPIRFSLQGVQISNAQISWQDQQADQMYQLNKFNLTTGNLYPGSASSVASSFQVSSMQPPLESDFEIKTEVEIGEALKRFAFNDLDIKLDAKGPLLPQNQMQLDLSTQAVLDLLQDTLMLKGLEINGPQITLTGNVNVKQLQKAPSTEASIQLKETNLKQIASLFGITLETQKTSAMTRFSADMQVQHKGNVLKLDPMKITLDESTLNGHLHVLETTGPTIHTALNIDQINIDHYLPPAAEQTPAETSDKKLVDKAIEQTIVNNPFTPLRTLDLQAEARIGKLTANKMHLQDVVVKAINKKGVLRLKPFDAKLYQGTFNGAITLNAQGKAPKIHAVKKLSGIQIGNLLADLMGEDRLLGKAHVELDMRTNGLSESAIRNSLNGNAKFKVLDGTYKGVNVAQLIREAGSALGLNTGQEATGEAKQTDFSELSGSAKINNGVISNQDLSAKSPLLRIDGKGKVNLPKDTIDYLLTTEWVVSLEGQGGKGRDDLSGVPIPVKIEGPLTNPSYRPELSALITKKAEERIKQEAAKLEKKIEQKIQDGTVKQLGKEVIKSEEVKDLFKGLFGQ